jgi:hypothetical protein
MVKSRPRHIRPKISSNYLPVQCQLWADCLDNVGSLTSHNPIGLHGLLQGIAFIIKASLLINILAWDQFVVHKPKYIPGHMTKSTINESDLGGDSEIAISEICTEN